MPDQWDAKLSPPPEEQRVGRGQLLGHIQDSLNNVQWPYYDFIRDLDIKRSYNFIVVFDIPILNKLVDIYEQKIPQDEERQKLYKLLPTNDIESIQGWVKHLQTKFPQFNITALSLLSLAVINISQYTYDIDNVESPIIGQQVRAAHDIKFADRITITFREFFFYPIRKLLRLWFMSITNPYQRFQLKKEYYYGKIYRIEFDMENAIKKLDMYTNRNQSENETAVEYTPLWNGILKFNENNELESFIEDTVERVVVYDGVIPTNLPDPNMEITDVDLIQYEITFNVERAFELNEAQYYRQFAKLIGFKIEEDTSPPENVQEV